jgi:molybdopterin-containing oxidoreductase family iron-sulfur binding subunit
VIELLAQVLGLEQGQGKEGHAAGYELVRNESLLATKQGDFETVWNKTLRDGIVAGSEIPRIDNAAVNAAEVGRAVLAHKRSQAPSLQSFEVTFHQDSRLYDGRFSNNAWLMELPDPLSKLTWDNAALMSRTTAKALGVKNEDCVKITLDGRSIEMPVFILPGQAEFSIALTFGYGRALTAKHVVAQRDDGTGKPCGTNVFRLRTIATPHIAQGAKVERTGATVPLRADAGPRRDGEAAGRARGHADRVQGQRGLRLPDVARGPAGPRPEPGAREGGEGPPPKEGHAKEHEKVTEDSINTSLWPRREFEKESPDYQWGMVIDLNSCTGCNACVVACQAENNIPTVGKEQVRRSREMHWLRIDRYFGGISGEADLIGDHQDLLAERDTDPAAVHMPVPCMQCENAPCESVCPVMATTHTARV